MGATTSSSVLDALDFEDLAKVGFLGATRTIAVKRKLGRQFNCYWVNPGDP